MLPSMPVKLSSIGASSPSTIFYSIYILFYIISVLVKGKLFLKISSSCVYGFPSYEKENFFYSTPAHILNENSLLKAATVAKI